MRETISPEPIAKSKPVVSDKRVAIVTGGAMGIGAAIVQALRADNCHVISIDVAPAPAESASSGTPSVTYMHGDITSFVQCEAVVALAMELYGRLDILVNNAGIQPVASCVPIHMLSADLWHQVLGVNLHGVFHMCKASLPHMIQQHARQAPALGDRASGGVIINISSIQGT